LQKWTAAQRKLVQEDGVSREELLEQLVPLAGAKVVHDPGVKVIDDFMKLHKKLQVSFQDQH
jgi:DNA replicative helicase MCM subunit Mcm2 (Cdc46/Mcm family)